MTENPSTSDWARLMPALFVVLWGTGFIGAKLGLPYAEPWTFLALRFAIVVVLLGFIVLFTRAEVPRSLTMIFHLAMVGVLVHGFYLGGVFAAISLGISAGLSSLIVGLQPLATACLVGPFLGETVSPRQWIGFTLGFAGVVLVVIEQVQWTGQHVSGIALCVFALAGITLGTVYQKRFCSGMDLRSGSLVQFAAATCFTLVLALILENHHIQWSGEFVFALTWLVVVLSIGAITLLMLLVRRGAASRVASLFYLVPPVTALMAWLIFDERLAMLAIAGMGLTAVGVWLIVGEQQS